MSLPKVISQDTFDQVVLENIQEFDKTLGEAIEEATLEFEAQGVLLSNVIKRVSLGPNKDKIVHPILEALDKIKQATSESAADGGGTSDQLSEALSCFTEECNLSLAHRVMAAKEGGYTHLLQLVNTAKSDASLLVPCLRALVALTDGNPDILDASGKQLMKDLLDQWASDTSSDVAEYLARWCQACNYKHEANREMLFAALVPKPLVASLKCCDPELHKSRILATFKAIRSFTLDDDIRAEFGKAHENCRYLVEEEGLIQVALGVIKGAVSNKVGAVTGEALATLSCVCVRAEYCQQSCDAGALEVINSILINFPDSALLTKQSIALIATLAGDDKVKVEVMKSGTAHLITKAMDRHQLHVGVCTASCSAVSMLALRHPKHSIALVECGAASGVLQAMKQHPKEKQLQKLACLAVRNLCTRQPAQAALLCSMQAEDLVKKAVELHGEAVKDLAKSALRDLGVEVALEEQWKGRGHELEQGA